jgi:DNA-binding CsgD family transcriptional regulator
MTMISIEAFSELLAVLYSAPLQPERWELFLDLLCEHTQSRSSFLICADSRQSLSVQAQGGVHQSPAAVAEYAAIGAARDPFMLPLIRSRKLGVMDCEELLPRATLEASDMYRHVHHPRGYRYPGLVALTCTLRRLEVLSFWRSEDVGYLDDDAVRLLQLLVPHLQAAMEIRQVLGTAQVRAKGAMAMADASATPTFLLGGDGEILHTNAAARKLLQEGDGLIVKQKRMHAAKNTMRKPLRELLSRAHASVGTFAGSRGAKPLALERPSGRRPLQLLASPVPGPGLGGIMLLATDPEKPTAFRDDVLREHYSFTEAETEVANGLLTGYSLEEIAALRKVRIGTVRDQVKSMLAKTATGRQAEMIRLMLTLPRMDLTEDQKGPVRV